MLDKYHRRGEMAARDELVERFLPLARQLARRYQRGNEPLDDLIQVASIGLVKAVDRYDPERGTAFSSYAVPTILGELKRYFRDSGWAVHVPRGMQERVMTVNNAINKLSRELGRSPTASEVADEIHEDPELVLEILKVPFAVPLAVLMAFLDLIPLVGATIAGVVIGIVCAIQDFPTAVIVWVVYLVVYQQTDNNFLQPIIYRRTVALHPLVVLVGVLIGAELLGVLGALLAIPVAGAIQIVLKDWWHMRKAPPAVVADPAAG